jgi:hypothetical protein
MPNRILRDWTDSFTIDELDANTERFFVRLIMKVDDYGRFFADARLLRANLFPLKTDVRDTDISRWLTECEKAGLIVIYNVAKKEFLQINNFNQTLRQKKEKYPSPSTCIADDKQTHSTCIPETKGNENRNGVEGGNFHPPDLSKSNLFRQPIIPSKEDVWMYIRGLELSEIKAKEMAKKFWDECEASGWFYKNSPIINFRSRASSFVETWQRIDRKNNPSTKKELVQ